MQEICNHFGWIIAGPGPAGRLFKIMLERLADDSSPVLGGDLQMLTDLPDSSVYTGNKSVSRKSG